MRREYDFSKAVRGKFYRPGAKLLIPVYLEPKVQAAVAERAAHDGVAVSEMVNRVLERELVAVATGMKKPATQKSVKRGAVVLLMGATKLLEARHSKAGTKLYAMRLAKKQLGEAEAYRHNPIRKRVKTRALAGKKAAKRKR